MMQLNTERDKHERASSNDRFPNFPYPRYSRDFSVDTESSTDTEGSTNTENSTDTEDSIEADEDTS